MKVLSCFFFVVVVVVKQTLVLFNHYHTGFYTLKAFNKLFYTLKAFNSFAEISYEAGDKPRH